MSKKNKKAKHTQLTPDKKILIKMFQRPQYAEAFVASLKSTKNYGNILKATKQVSLTTHRFNREFYGAAFPKQKNQIHHIYSLSSQSIDEGIIWTSGSLIHFADEIKQFLKHKSSFENNVILGQYDKAAKELESLENAYGTSMWHIHSELLLAHIRLRPLSC